MPEPIDLFNETADDPKPFHRQIRLNNTTGHKTIESAPAFEAFWAYCIAGSSRSLRLVAQGLGKSAQLLARWSVRWNWQERTRAFDNAAAEQENTAFILERKSMARRQAQGALLGQNIALTSLMAIQEQLQEKGKQRGLNVHECARLFEVCSRIERINRGEYDENAVASIVVHIERQAKPRYADAEEIEKEC
jgi:hypothetical protein